jgi:hypothetical protein
MAKAQKPTDSTRRRITGSCESYSTLGHHSGRRRQAPMAFPALILGLLGMLLVVLPASAGEAVHRTGQKIEIGAEEVIDGDFFCTGETILMRGKVAGDLFVIGQSATIEGSVGGSVHFLGQTLKLSSEITGSVRAAGEKIFVEKGKIGRDLTVAGSEISVANGVTIGGGLAAAGKRIDIAGEVTGSTQLTALRGRLNGHFMGPVTVNHASAGNERIVGMDVGAEARLEQGLVVRGGKEPRIEEGAEVQGETTYIRQESEPEAVKQFSFLRPLLIMWFQFAVAGIGFRLLFPSRCRNYLRNFGARPGRVVVFGPLYYILIVLVGAVVVSGCATMVIGLGMLEIAEPLPLLITITFVAIVLFWGGGGLLGTWVAPTLFAGWLTRTLMGWAPGFRSDAMLLPLLFGSLLMACVSIIPLAGIWIWGALALFAAGVFLTGATPPPTHQGVSREPKGYERIR